MSSRPIWTPCLRFCAAPNCGIKQPLVATERNRPDVRHKRRLLHKKQKLMKLEPYRLVFIVETSTKTYMTRMYGRAPKGIRLEADVPYGHSLPRQVIAKQMLRGGKHRPSLQAYVTTGL